MDNIKLIIWDLDDTVWKGTISEEKVLINSDFKHFIIKMTKRGIISSICSKNDYEIAKEELVANGLWQYIVFPSINWESKGQRVKDIIKTMSLRNDNVLFVDDNNSNLEEVKYFNPGIETVTPTELRKIWHEPVFEGKKDEKMSRLNQYKLLEIEFNEKKKFATNMEFLFHSKITVIFEKNVENKIERIYEMINRNNQLNFTKNKISLEEVQELFTDKTVERACIHVTDLYGDHGIVGCYAVRNGKLEQFVFSCRILGMRVEQWVYAQLGYPVIDIVGPVAAELNNFDCPEWINQSDGNDGKKDNVEITHLDKSIILYGSCPLRPVWSYLEPIVNNTRFLEIDPEPSVCNLSRIICEDKAQIDEWLNKISVFDMKSSFDSKIFSSENDYILISLDSEMKFYRYSYGGHFFFSVELDSSNALDEILNKYEKRPISYSDIEEALEVICKNLSKGTTLLIQLLPDVIFSSKGKDQNYEQRIYLNKLAEKFSNKYENIRLIDIRKYAKTEMDFFNSSSSHYNRSIGYQLARNIISIMGLNESENYVEDNEDEKTIPKNAVVDCFGEKSEIICTTYIVNGMLYINMSRDVIDNYDVSYDFIRNRLIESRQQNVVDEQFHVRINRPGYWKVGIHFISKCFNQKSFYSETALINYNSRNYGLFEDSEKGDYKAYKTENDQFVKENIEYEKNSTRLIEQISELAAVGVNVADYFINKGIEEISVFVDENIASVLLPFLFNSPLHVKKVYTTDMMNAFLLNGGAEVKIIDDVNHDICMNEQEHMLLAFNGRMKDKWFSKFSNVNIHYLPYVLSFLKTEKFLCDALNKSGMPRNIVVRGANMCPFNAFPYGSVLSVERSAYRNGVVPISDEEKRIYEETLVYPNQLINMEQRQVYFKDIKGSYCNIIEGKRKTVVQGVLEKKTINVFLYGSSYVYGYGNRDEDTMGSQLQKMLGSGYRVINCANIVDENDYDKVIYSMLNKSYDTNDIIVLYLTNWQQPLTEIRWHWLNWDACVDRVEVCDTFPIFLERDRKQYFLTNGGYTREGNYEVAKLIYEQIK